MKFSASLLLLIYFFVNSGTFAAAYLYQKRRSKERTDLLTICLCFESFVRAAKEFLPYFKEKKYNRYVQSQLPNCKNVSVKARCNNLSFFLFIVNTWYYCVMGTSYSVEEVEKDIDKLKRDVLAFNGTISSKSYSRLQKKLIQANEKILNVKQSSASLIQGVCDQLLKELNECLEILTAKVTNKDGDEYEDRELEEERDFIKHRRENDAKVIILGIEKEILYVEYEVENIIETKDSGRKDLLKSELKTYFKELALAKTERESSLDDRKNKIIQRLVNCYKQLINVEEVIEGWIQFENQFNKNPPTSDQFKVSSELIQRLKCLYHENSDSISSSEQDSLSTSSYISDVDNLPHDIVVNNNHFNNSHSRPEQTLHHKVEESPPSVPPKPPNDSNESSETNIRQDVKPVTEKINKTDLPRPLKHHKDDESPPSLPPRPPNASDESGETNIWQDVKPVAQKINKTPPPRPPKQKNKSSKISIAEDAKPAGQQINEGGFSQSISDNVLLCQKMNSIREILMKIKTTIDVFDKSRNDPEYTKIEHVLLHYLDEVAKIDPQGNQSVIVNRQQHVDYVYALMDYLIETADLMEQKRKTEQTPPNCDSQTLKINPPVPKKPSIAQKPSFPDKKVVLNASEESKRINPPVVAETSSAQTRMSPKVVRPVAVEETNLNRVVDTAENQTKSFTTHKILPPIVKESTANANKLWIGKEKGDLRNQILPPIVKTAETNQEEFNENEKAVKLKETSPRKKLVSDPESEGAEKSDESFGGEADDQKDAISDALNLYLLKRFSSCNSEKNVYSNEESIDKRAKQENTESEEDYIRQIKSVLEDVEELKILDKFFKQARNFKIYKDMQDILTRVVTTMVHIDPTVLSKEYILLYEVVSQDIEKFIKDAYINFVKF